MGCITLWEINQFSKKIFTSLWTMVMDAVTFFAFKLTYSRITAKLERRYTFILWWGDRDSGRSKKSEGATDCLFLFLLLFSFLYLQNLRGAPLPLYFRRPWKSLELSCNKMNKKNYPKAETILSWHA